MASIIGQDGGRHDVPVTLSMYQEAAAAKLSLPHYLAKKYPADTSKGSTFEQILASEGVFIKGDRAAGIAPTTVREMLDGGVDIDAGSSTRDQTPVSRILFPATILTAVENKLVSNLTQTPAAFDTMVAVNDSIAGDKFDRPVLNFTNAETPRSQRIAQLAIPASMLIITASEVSRRVPTFSLGLEISDQAQANTTLDFLTLTLSRQALTEKNTRTNEYLLALMNGDTDNSQLALSSISGKVVAASSLDSASSSGTLTHLAWMTWLQKNSLKRTITHVVTDFATAFKIENRVGKPIITTDNPNSTRIDTVGTVMNPGWTSGVKIFISADPNWPSGTIMGIDQAYAIHRVRSLSAEYQAIEQFVMKRSTQYRFDFGEIVYRLFDDAFEVLTLT